ncbi:MAG: hypothetical protein WBP53_11810 [Dokdonella sp.]
MLASTDFRKRTVNQDAPIRLYFDGEDCVVDRGRREPGIDFAIGQESCDTNACRPGDVRELTGNDHIAIGLHRQGSHGVVRVRDKAVLDVAGPGCTARKQQNANQLQTSK